MNILLAGSRGTIGRNIATTLGAHKVTAFSTTELDLVDPQAVDHFAKHDAVSYDVVIFLVGLAHKHHEKNTYKQYQALNFLSLKNLLNALDRHNKQPKKIVFASSIAVYGERWEQNIYSEDTNTAPKDYYGQTKLEAEVFLQTYYADKSIVLRIAPVYSHEFVLNLVRRISLKGLCFRVNRGNQQLSLCHVENIVKTLHSVISDSIPPGTYNIADRMIYTYNDIIHQQNRKVQVSIPRVLGMLVFLIAKLIRKPNLAQNVIKLITDNLYPSEKLARYVELDMTLASLRD